MELVIYLIALTALIIAVILYLLKNAFSLPPNRPEMYLKSGKLDQGPVIAFLGDSITHGVCSHNYVEPLTKQLHSHRPNVVNAGINGDLAYNLNQRIDDIIQCRPDVLTILIGTNDVGASINDKANAFYVKLKKLPVAPNLEWYKIQLSNIIDRLLNETSAEIAIFSLPVLGEDLSSLANRNATLYSEAVKEIASEKNITYLPLNEKQRSYLENNPSIDAEVFTQTNSPRTLFALVEHNVLFRSYDDIGRRRGLQLTSECVHMNSRGAAMIIELALPFFEEKMKKLAL
jgi:lysophospholipase L1-like esterase